MPRNGFSPKPELQGREAERQLVQRLKERCQQQARQLGLVQGELRRAMCGFQALAVSTQYFSRKVRPRLVNVEGLFAGKEGGDGDSCVCVGSGGLSLGLELETDLIFRRSYKSPAATSNVLGAKFIRYV